jgi:hypothetical protein
MFIIVELSFCPLVYLAFDSPAVPRPNTSPSSKHSSYSIMMLLSAKRSHLAHTAVQMEGLKTPPLSGVHLSTPPEYLPLQHPFLHWEFLEHCAQSPSDPVVGGVGVGGGGAGVGPDPAMQMLGLKPPLSGVHLSTPPEYMPLQHPFLHWEFEEHCAQSPSDPVVGGVGVGGVAVGGGIVPLCQAPISSRVIAWL